ncbi:MAG: hypothetical protein AB8B69_26600, partial [Chitinophagales bacterium]
MKQELQFFEVDGHLNIGGRILYAEAIQMDKKDALPKKLYLHGNSCSECSMEILLLSTLLKEEYTNMTQAQHPYLDYSNSKYAIGDDL